MSSLFIAILNMSLTASYVALIVIAIRFLLTQCRVPIVFAYILWSVVLFRLTVPVSFESAMSIIPGKMTVTSPGFSNANTSSLNSGHAIADQSLHQSLAGVAGQAAETGPVNPMQIWLEIGAYLWLLVAIALVAYVLISYVRLKRKLVFATRKQGNIFESDQIETPFVFGFLKPRIYLPLGLAAEEAGYIIKHEQTHIRRFDHLVKPFAFLVLSFHWFNPIMWLAYFLMIKDMEMSCDERVIKETNQHARISYSRTLLSLASKQSGLIGPLSFGESNVKARIRHVLNYKRPTFWVGVVVVIAVVALAISLLVNPVTSERESTDEQQVSELVENFGSKLKAVSLTDPPSIIARSMQENYGDYVTAELMSFWVENAAGAPGRHTSSPWPERIDIDSVERRASDAYEVAGRIIEITAGGEAAATRPIELEIKRLDDRWMITDSILGPYEEDSGTNPAWLAGYISFENDMLTVDPVEVITTAWADQFTGLDLHDPERMAELGLQEGDMPNGYYIHHPELEPVTVQLTDKTVFTFTDIGLLFVENPEGDRRYTTSNRAEYIEHISTSMTSERYTGKVPYPVFVEVNDGKAVSMTEIFLFTQ